MAAEENTPSVQKSSFLLRCWAPLLFVFGLTISILLGVYASMEWAVYTTIKAKSEDAAMMWASHFNDEEINLGSIVDRGALSANQQKVVTAAVDFSAIYSLVIFDTQGNLVYSSDHGITERSAAHTADERAAAVAATELPIVDIVTRQTGAEDPTIFVHALVPAFGADGSVIGVIGLFMDETQSAAVYTKIMNRLGWILPALCAIFYAFPALAYVLKREQVNARTERVVLLSRTDQLTGALNRHTMAQESKKLFINRGHRERLGVFFLDIDTFKSVNDVYGHEFGDAYLQFISSVILNNVRPIDLVGRMGGDEFVIALPKVTPKIMKEIGQGILCDARAPFEYKGRTMQASVSIGYYIADRSVRPEQALHAADLALYHAKASGRNSLVEYFPELDIAMIRRRAIEARIREAMVQNDFKTMFQPIVDPKNKSVLGFEALLRLNAKDGEPISPNEFVPIAEESGMIQQIGTFTLRNAITTAKTWPEHVFVSVNLSPAQFKQGDLVTQVSDILSDLDFPASRLEFEVTEGLLLADEQHISDQLIGLKQLGISIAMDDFGTGYSSLGYLWKYSFDKLKIDRVFLEGYDFDRERYSQIIETIVILGHKMGMAVTVEGVETKQHHEMLDKLGCDQYQGFYFGKPMSPQQALRMLGHATDDDVSGLT